MPTAETIGSIFEYLFETSVMAVSEIAWPPGAFCFAALALQKSSAYTHLIGPEKPRLIFKHARKDREKALGEVGERWKTANLLLLPWPKEVVPQQFRPTEAREITDEVGRGGYGLFTFDGLRQPRVGIVRELLKSAEKMVGRIDGVVFPELALPPSAAKKISAAIVQENRFLISGVGQPAKKAVCGENYIRFDVMLPGGEYFAELRQKKHHRWKLEKNQIIQYGIGSARHPLANWWEHIDLTDRRLVLVTLKPWLTVCVLLCEDLGWQRNTGAKA